MISGVRLATVTTIGLATVTSLLGDTFGGFGFLTEGQQKFFSTEIYLGAFLTVLAVWRTSSWSAGAAVAHAVGPGPGAQSPRPSYGRPDAYPTSSAGSPIRPTGAGPTASPPASWNISRSASLVAIVMAISLRRLWIGHTGRGPRSPSTSPTSAGRSPRYALMGIVLPISLAVDRTGA